jgi:two-component system, sensor histidine kinase ChiS
VESYSSANVLSFIFNHFYRVRDVNVKGIEGTDLKLAIIKSIAGQHIGQISVTSESGKSSCFSFSLPLAWQETEAIFSSKTNP